MAEDGDTEVLTEKKTQWEDPADYCRDHDIKYNDVRVDPDDDTPLVLTDEPDKTSAMVLYGAGHIHTKEGRCFSRKAGPLCTDKRDEFDDIMDGYDDEVVVVNQERWDVLQQIKTDGGSLPNTHLHLDTGECVLRGGGNMSCIPVGKEAKAYPEHEKMRAIKPQADIIAEFLEWYIEETDIRLDIEGVLASYFKIDRDKIEEEKSDMLGSIRQKNHAAEVLARRKMLRG